MKGFRAGALALALGAADGLVTVASAEDGGNETLGIETSPVDFGGIKSQIADLKALLADFESGGTSVSTLASAEEGVQKGSNIADITTTAGVAGIADVFQGQNACEVEESIPDAIAKLETRLAEIDKIFLTAHNKVISQGYPNSEEIQSHAYMRRDNDAPMINRSHHFMSDGFEGMSPYKREAVYGDLADSHNPNYFHSEKMDLDVHRAALNETLAQGGHNPSELRQESTNIIDGIDALRASKGIANRVCRSSDAGVFAADVERLDSGKIVIQSIRPVDHGMKR